MNHMFFFMMACVALCISKISSETIEISTLVPSMTSTVNPKSVKSQNWKGNVLADFVENFLPESTNLRKIDESQDYSSQKLVPVYPPPNSYFYPGVNPNDAAVTSGTELQDANYFSSILPAAQMGFEVLRQYFLYFLVRHLAFKLIRIFELILNIRDVLIPDEISKFLIKAALSAALQLFTKLGLYLVSGAGLLVLGGIFTTLLCYFTPVCTITFNGFDFQQALSKDTMRSLVTSEKIATAAALVQDAIGKYQRLQRAVNQ
ncbi:uncharacterized protein [Euwallacea fornicatus]|uniref:uncharacterized protein isoform X1 n=1 Tax=Euwallacea fornicatus TaxID=995702 RepID=UPI00338F2271